MSRCSCPCLALLAPVLLLLGGSPARAAGIQHYRYLEAQVFTSPGLGSVAVGMPNKRTVKIQHLDPATGQLGLPVRAVPEEGGHVR